MTRSQERVSAPAGVEYDKKLAGRRVRHAREDLGLKVEQLAALLTQNTPETWTKDKVKNLEAGRKAIEPPLLRTLSEVLGRPVNYFLYADFQPTGNLPELSRVSSDAGAKILPFRKPVQRAARPIAPPRTGTDPVSA